MLLVGPTGSGKTPLGQMLEERGWQGRDCVHFDFGEHLRRAVASGPSDGLLNDQEHAFLTKIVNSGALLEDRDFPIAERIFREFLQPIEHRDKSPWIVLNGLPRHEGQAVAISSHVNIRYVVQLRCAPDVVHARIATNRGGDRAGRTDDAIADIEKKLQIYDQRTAPLIDYLQHKQAAIITLDVTNDMTPQQAWQLLQDAQDK